MGLHKEISFENEICERLGAASWISEGGAAARYTPGRAVFPEDPQDWLRAAQSKA